MAGRRVHEAGAGIVGHMVAIEQRNVKGVAQCRERMVADQTIWIGICDAREGLDLGGLHHFFGKLVSQDVAFALLGPVALGAC